MHGKKHSVSLSGRIDPINCLLRQRRNYLGLIFVCLDEGKWMPAASADRPHAE
jgi:hypothetical protein